VDDRADAVDQVQPQRSAEGVADGESDGGADPRGRERRPKGQVALHHQVSGKDEQDLIRNGNAHDAQHQE